MDYIIQTKGRDRLINKQDPIKLCLWQKYFKFKDTNRWKVKG